MHEIFVKGDINDIRKILSKDNIIIKENPKHNLGHQIVYKSKNINDEFYKILGKENIIELNETHIVCKGFDPKFRNPVIDILIDYNKTIDHSKNKYSNGIYEEYFH